MAVDRIRHSKPASKRTFLDELEPIPYEISEEEMEQMDPRMKEVLFGIKAPELSDYEEEISQEDIAEDIVETVVEAITAEPLKIEPEPQEEPDKFDHLSLVDFSDAPLPHVTLIFPAEEEEEEIVKLASEADDYKTDTVEGKLWHVARFGRNNAKTLQNLNVLLGKRENTFALMNGKRVPFGRSLWLPLMFIFTAGQYS